MMAEVAVFLEGRDGGEFIGSTAIDGFRATTIHCLRTMMHKNLDKPLPKFQFLGSTGKPIDDEQVGPGTPRAPNQDPASFHRKAHSHMMYKQRADIVREAGKGWGFLCLHRSPSTLPTDTAHDFHTPAATQC